MSIAGTNGFLDEFYRNTGQYDAKSDAYSMGVTLLIILTGFPVFHERLGYIVRRCEVEGNSVMTIADPSAQWPQEVAREMHKVAMALVIEPDRDARMSVSNALDAVQRLVARHPAPAPILEDTEIVCLICMSEPRYFRFGECGHSLLCRKCMETFMRRPGPQCPNCRSPVSRERLIQGDNVASEDTFIRPLAAAAAAPVLMTLAPEDRDRVTVTALVIHVASEDTFTVARPVAAAPVVVTPLAPTDRVRVSALVIHLIFYVYKCICLLMRLGLI
jgi:hypothetical protein